MEMNIKKLSRKFYKELDYLMLLIDYIASKQTTEEMVMRQLGKVHYLYNIDKEKEE